MKNENILTALLKLADDSRYTNADAYHALWRRGQRAKLSGDELAYLWSELTARAKARKLGHIAGRKYTPGTGVTPAEQELPALPEKPEKPAKQAKAKAEKPAKQAKAKAETPAKQEKPAKAETPAKAKTPTQKEILANLLATAVATEKRMAAIEKRMAAIEKKLA